MSEYRELRWYLVGGDYCEALVAAYDADEALAYAEQSGWYEPSAWYSPKWFPPTEAKLPGPPTAPGVYHVYGE